MDNETVVLSGRMRVMRPYSLHVLNWAKSPPLNWEKQNVREVEKTLLSGSPSCEDWFVWLLDFGKSVQLREVCTAAPNREAVCGDWSDLVALVRQPFSLPRHRPIVALDSFLRVGGPAPFACVDHKGDINFGSTWGVPDLWSADCLFLFISASD